MKPLHIFKPGTHTAMNGVSFDFSESDLAATVRAYDPALHEAPMVIGHPQHNAPAAGWVKSLTATAQGLIAELQQVDVSFAEQVAKGSYKKKDVQWAVTDTASPTKIPIQTLCRVSSGQRVGRAAIHPEKCRKLPRIF